MRVDESLEHRERLLPGPTPGTGYRTVALVGETGSGKTTLARQLIGVAPSGPGFPATSVSRTTTATTEILVAPGDFYAVATFMPRATVLRHVEECFIAAAEGILDRRRPERIRQSVRIHPDLSFRLHYVLGDDEHGWVAATVERLEAAVSRFATAGVSSEDQLPQAVLTSIHQLADEVTTEIGRRIARLARNKLVLDPSGWPAVFHTSTRDIDQFLAEIDPLVSNDAALFGRLLAPVVDGIRVRGPFHPTWSDEIYYLMLIDDEGIGHSLSTGSALPSSMLERVGAADTVLVVNNASAPMMRPTVDALTQLVAAGYTDRLVLCFTHFDEVTGPNLADEGDKREFLYAVTEDALNLIRSELGWSAAQHLRRRLDENTLFFGLLHEPVDEVMSPIATGVGQLLHRVKAGSEAVVGRPVGVSVDEGQLHAEVDAALAGYRRVWMARLELVRDPNVAPEHWRRIKALASRLGSGAEEGFEQLQPVGELIATLLGAVRRGVAGDDGRGSDDAGDERVAAWIDHLTRVLNQPLLDLVRQRLCVDAQAEWREADNMAGSGVKKRRARFVYDRIFVKRLGIAAENSELTDRVVELVVEVLASEGTRPAGRR